MPDPRANTGSIDPETRDPRLQRRLQSREAQNALADFRDDENKNPAPQAQAPRGSRQRFDESFQQAQAPRNSQQPLDAIIQQNQARQDLRNANPQTQDPLLTRQPQYGAFNVGPLSLRDVDKNAIQQALDLGWRVEQPNEVHGSARNQVSYTWLRKNAENQYPDPDFNASVLMFEPCTGGGPPMPVYQSPSSLPKTPPPHGQSFSNTPFKQIAQGQPGALSHPRARAQDQVQPRPQAQHRLSYPPQVPFPALLYTANAPPLGPKIPPPPPPAQAHNTRKTYNTYPPPLHPQPQPRPQAAMNHPPPAHAHKNYDTLPPSPARAQKTYNTLLPSLPPPPPPAKPQATHTNAATQAYHTNPYFQPGGNPNS